MAAVPFDQVLGIMAMLPVKSLMRLRIISKFFFSATADSYFITSHLALFRASGNVSCLWIRPISIHIRDSSLSKVIFPETPVSLDEYSEEANFCMVGSCNGLVCFSDQRDSHFGRNLILWNPIIRKTKSTSATSLNQNTIHDENTQITLGFGYDDKLNDYKIIRVVVSKDENELSPQAEIYSLNADSWKTLNFSINSVREIYVWRTQKSTSFHGALHWMTFIPGGTDSIYDPAILSFEIDDEQFKVTRLPEYDAREASYADLVVTKESLGLPVHYYIQEEDGAMEEEYMLWKLSKYYSWTGQILPVRPTSNCWGYTDDGRLVLVTDDFTPMLYCTAMLYNPDTEDSKEITLDFFGYTVPFRESLGLL